jgi:uncharacterized protein YukE
MMDIDKAFEQFIEFPEGSSGNLVTTVSAKLFAKYCTETLQEENERLQADVERLRKQVHELQNQREHMYDTMLQWRGIERENGDEPCRGCNGSGVRAYGNATTWRGGVGGQVITSDVCDKCWGSGNSENVWVNLKSIARISRKEAELVDVCGQLRAEVERLRAYVSDTDQWTRKLEQTVLEISEERDQLKAKLSREEDQHMNTVDQRDMTEQFADRLASGIAEALGIEIGEHSSANNPWAEAITAIEEFDITQHDADVIERARAYVTSEVNSDSLAEDYDSALEDYAKQLRQQAKEVQS